VPLRVTPAARFEDGIDFAAPQRVRPVDVPRLLMTLLRGSDRDPGVLRGHDLDRIVVRCDRPLPLQADGEDLGDVEQAVFEAKRDAISVLV
jgi:diacylglycerol kinase family enzyme